jgi:hypothetical protein
VKKILLGLAVVGVLGLAAFWMTAAPPQAPIAAETKPIDIVPPQAPEAALPQVPPVAVSELPPLPASPATAPAPSASTAQAGRPAPVSPPVAAPASVPAAAVDNTGLPPGPNREMVAQACGNCHDVSTFSGQRHTRAEWANIMQSMTGNGLSVTDDDWKKIEDYLTIALGR